MHNIHEYRLCVVQVVTAMRHSPKGWFLVPVGAQITSQREYVALHKAGTSPVRLSSPAARLRLRFAHTPQLQL